MGLDEIIKTAQDIMGLGVDGSMIVAFILVMKNNKLSEISAFMRGTWNFIIYPFRRIKYSIIHKYRKWRHTFIKQLDERVDYYISINNKEMLYNILYILNEFCKESIDELPFYPPPTDQKTFNNTLTMLKGIGFIKKYNPNFNRILVHDYILYDIINNCGEIDKKISSLLFPRIY